MTDLIISPVRAPAPISVLSQTFAGVRRQMHLHDKEWDDLGVHVGRSTPIMISALGRCDDETQCG